MPQLNLVFRGRSCVLSWPDNKPDSLKVDMPEGIVLLEDMSLEESYRIKGIVRNYNIKLEGEG